MNRKHIGALLERSLKPSVGGDNLISEYIIKEYSCEIDQALSGKKKFYPDMDQLAEDVLLSISEIAPGLITDQFVAAISKNTGATILNDTLIKIMAKNLSYLVKGDMAELIRLLKIRYLPTETYCAMVKMLITEKCINLPTYPEIWNLPAIEEFEEFRSWIIIQYIAAGGDDAIAMEASSLEFFKRMEAERLSFNNKIQKKPFKLFKK